MRLLEAIPPFNLSAAIFGPFLANIWAEQHMMEADCLYLFYFALFPPLDSCVNDRQMVAH